jgi:NAD(P)-dependent dehydrogenase (short-subunit alcohol dehydrogenase family)
MNIIVTGASRGIGYELVKQFSRSPGNRILAISRNKLGLETLRESCLTDNPESDVICIPFDLESGLIREDLANQVEEHMDCLDILVNNAGYLVRDSFLRLASEEFRKCLDVNYLAPVQLIQSVFDLLRKSPGAHVINISSMGGVQGSKKFPGLSAYSASKAALQVITECLAEEFGDTNIAFNALALGAVRTEMLAEAFPGYQAPLEAPDMAGFIADFAVNGRRFYQGKTIQVSLSTP